MALGKIPQPKLLDILLFLSHDESEKWSFEITLLLNSFQSSSRLFFFVSRSIFKPSTSSRWCFFPPSKMNSNLIWVWCLHVVALRNDPFTPHGLVSGRIWSGEGIFRPMTAANWLHTRRWQRSTRDECVWRRVSLTKSYLLNLIARLPVLPYDLYLSAKLWKNKYTFVFLDGDQNRCYVMRLYGHYIFCGCFVSWTIVYFECRLFFTLPCCCFTCELLKRSICFTPGRF